MFGFGKNTKKKDTWSDAADMAEGNTAVAGNALRIAKETKEIGAHTLNELDIQEEKIDHINDGLAEININTDEAEKKIGHIRSVIRAIAHSLKKHLCCCCLSTPEDDLEEEKSKNRKIGKPKKKFWSKDAEESSDSELPSVVYLPSWQRPTDHPLTADEARFAAANDRTDQTVHDIHRVVHDIKDQAIDMGNKLDRRNKKLDRGNQLATTGKDKLAKNNRRMKLN
jgi:hypothetical protein